MSITRVNQFKAASGKEEKLFDFLQSLTSYITNSDGCISYEVLRDIEDQSTFLIIEKWESINAHKNSVNSFPKEEMQSAMSLFGGPPSGKYYSGSG